MSLQGRSLIRFPSKPSLGCRSEVSTGRDNGNDGGWTGEKRTMRANLRHGLYGMATDCGSARSET